MGESAGVVINAKPFLTGESGRTFDWCSACRAHSLSSLSSGLGQPIQQSGQYGSVKNHADFWFIVRRWTDDHATNRYAIRKERSKLQH
jgi:hypothetical protein